MKSPQPSIQSVHSLKSPPLLESVPSSLKNTASSLVDDSLRKTSELSQKSVSSLKNVAPSQENAPSSLESAAKESLAICTAKVKVEMEDESPLEICVNEKTFVNIKEEPWNNYDESKTIPSVKNHFANVKNGQHFHKSATKLQSTLKSGRSPKVLSHLPKLKQRIERLPNFNPKAYEIFSKRLKNEKKQPYQLLGEFFAKQNAEQIVRTVDRSQVLTTVDASKLVAEERSPKKPAQKAQSLKKPMEKPQSPTKPIETAQPPKKPHLPSVRVTRSQKSYDKAQNSAIANPNPTRSSLRIACKAPGKSVRVKQSDSVVSESTSEESIEDTKHPVVEKDDKDKHDVASPILTASESLPAAKSCAEANDDGADEEKVSKELINPTEESEAVTTKDSLAEGKSVKTNVLLAEDKPDKNKNSLTEDKSVKNNVLLIEDKSVNTDKALKEDKFVKSSISLAEDKSVKNNVLLSEDKSVNTKKSLSEDKFATNNVLLAEDKSVNTKKSFTKDKSVKSKDLSTQEKPINIFVPSKSSVPEAVKIKYADCSKSIESPTALCLTNKTSNSSLQFEKTSPAKVQKVVDEVSSKEDSKTPEVSPLNFTVVGNNNETTDTASETEVLIPSKANVPEEPQNLQVLKSPIKVGLNLADSLARSPAAKIAKQLGMPVAKQLEQYPHSGGNASSNEILRVTDESSNETAGADNEQAMNLKVHRNEEQRSFDNNSPSKKVKRNLFFISVNFQ